MKKTPFIKPIKVQGGTFYSCVSAGEDLQLSLADSKNEFRFSKFALLKLPKILTNAEQQSPITIDDIKKGNPTKNYAQLNIFPVAHEISLSPDAQADPNNVFAESFQNYFYNFETLLTNQEKYNIEEKRTVSERVFFKWLKEIGAIRFADANGKDSNNTNNASATGIHYVEENEDLDTSGKYIYERVVKYIGDINVLNKVKNKANSYTEVYMHIPTNHGCTKDVLFNSIEDNNYHHDMTIKHEPIDPINANYLYGRDKDEENLTGLNTFGYFDSSNSFSKLWSWDPAAENTYFDKTEDGTYPKGKWVAFGEDNFSWWFDKTSSNSYFTEPNSFANPLNEYYAIGGNPNIDDANNRKYTESEKLANRSVKVLRSKLDGISLEFNPNAYKEIVDRSLRNLGEYNETGKDSQSFSFNTVLVYYDVYDKDNPSDYTTNLFGILFLDNVESVGYGAEIESMTKYKPSTLLQQNGNSYAFKLNIKFDLSSQDSDVEITVNDYNTFSLQLYAEALTRMKEAGTMMNEALKSNRSIVQEIDNLKSLLYSRNNAFELKTRIDELENRINEAATVFSSNDSLMKLINRNYDEIINIYKGKTSVEMNYNTQFINAGTGIEVFKNPEMTNITLSNAVQDFNISSKPIVSIKSDFKDDVINKNYSYVVDLLNYDNYLKINDSKEYGNPFDVDKDIIIYINDKDINWKSGQRFRITFNYGLYLSNDSGNYNIKIYTDADDKSYSGTKYGILIGEIGFDAFNVYNSYKPVIEIICLNSDFSSHQNDVQKFTIDIL